MYSKELLKRLFKRFNFTKKKTKINVHRYVAERFTECDPKNKKMVGIGRDLARLRKDRNKADYEDNIVCRWHDQAKLSLRIANNIINTINELIEESTLR